MYSIMWSKSNSNPIKANAITHTIHTYIVMGSFPILHTGPMLDFNVHEDNGINLRCLLFQRWRLVIGYH